MEITLRFLFSFGFVLVLFFFSSVRKLKPKKAGEDNKFLCTSESLRMVVPLSLCL